MKIAFIGGRDIHTLGGIENYMYNLATELKKLGHEPVVYCESDSERAEIVNGFLVKHRKAVGGRFLCKIILGLTSTIDALRNEEGVEYLHYNAWPPSLWSWIARLAGRKTVLQGHGLEWKRTKYSPVQRRIMHFMEWLTAKMNPNVTVVSDEQREYFAEAYNRTCVTIPTAVNIPSGEAAESDVLDRFGLTEGGYFLYLGRLVKDKNPDVLIRAYLTSGIKDKKLVIAGSNDQLPDFVAELHALGRGCERVVFTGAVYGNDKERLLGGCFAFCIPSTVEGLAITLLEAMSYAKPCISSDIPSNREGLGDNGLWVRAEDVEGLAEVMRHACENGAQITVAAQKNRTRVEKKFTWARISEAYAAYLKSL